ncbi:hypothetical protein B5P19_01050 [Clavibacter sepedonicus]|nr:hypothetical protein B5P19_01050 [Clavibacter sepedonicus]OQJ55214.1 hypothetical protein B5P20_14740 [Clavibacter sepedonicus]
MESGVNPIEPRGRPLTAGGTACAADGAPRGVSGACRRGAATPWTRAAGAGGARGGGRSRSGP